MRLTTTMVAAGALLAGTGCAPSDRAQSAVDTMSIPVTDSTRVDDTLPLPYPDSLPIPYPDSARDSTRRR